MELPGLWSLTPVGGMLGMLAVLYWLVASGRLVPKSSHDQQLEVVVKRGDEWKETAMEQRKVNDVIRAQNTDLIQANQVIEQLLRAAGPPNLGTTGGA